MWTSWGGMRASMRSQSDVVDFEENEEGGLGDEELRGLRNGGSVDPAAQDCPAIVTAYLTECSKYGVEANSGVLVALRFRLPVLRPTKPFHCKDMMPLAEVLMLAQSKGGAAHIETADFSLARLRSHGAIVLAKCLPWTTLKSIELRHNPIGGHGAHALAVALSSNATVVRVGMRGCSVGRVGAESFAELVVERGCSRLRHVDMSVNSAGLQGALRMKRALAFSSGKISVQMDNNIVLAEVLNSVTHGIGLLMTGVASTFMSQRASNGGSWAHSWSSQVYVCSLLTMYGASTLYHSFYFTLHTKELFHVFDQCAIYMLIAGTYTPVLAVSLHDQTMYSTWLLGLMWAICLSGITMTATYYGPLKGRISLTLYLVMGWAALVCIRDIAIVLPPQGLFWLVMGGVLYTLGVPFFVMDSDPTTSMYHVVWHLFVMAASMAHFWMIYEYVMPTIVSEGIDAIQPTPTPGA